MPKVFVMENVSGMVKGKMKLIFAEILTELKACGYQVSAKLLNAMYLGVPQSRQRMIFIGVRNDLGIAPSHPKPQTKPIVTQLAFNGVDIGHYRSLSKQAEAIYNATPQGESLEIGALKVIGKDNYYTHRRLSFNRPANCIQKSAGSSIYHPTEPRLLSIAELQRLQSFPDRYTFLGEYNSQWARIGNSVPPRMMQYVAQHIYDNILSKCKNETP